MTTKLRPWIADDDRRLLELRAAGRTSVSIAAALKRTAVAIDGRLYVLRKREQDALVEPDFEQ